jgi:hypothetical protein
VKTALIIAALTLAAPATAGELDKMIASGDVPVMRDYLQAQANAGKIEPDFNIDDTGDGNVDINFMGPYIHNDAKVPNLNWFQAIAGQRLARQWGRAFCDAMERSQRKRGTNTPWNIKINAWYLPAKNKPNSAAALTGYDLALTCQLGSNYIVTVSDYEQHGGDSR